jgi:hypothetical protein
VKQDIRTKSINFRFFQMPVPQGYQVVGSQGQGPSCWQKLKMGFAMGAVIGASTGNFIEYDL